MNTAQVSPHRPFFSFAVSLILALAILSSAWAQSDTKSRSGVDVRGTWSGTFFSKHNNVAPFTMTVVITPNANGHLVGNSSLNSNCLKDVQLQATVSGSQVVLSGSDDSGDNITVRGTLDTTGSILKTSYILNGSASGKCETDNGTGNLARR